jgi:hypothetical protein
MLERQDAGLQDEQAIRYTSSKISRRIINLIPLRNKTIGGNTLILFAVDEKSGYCSGVPISKKQTTNIVEAFKILLSEYSSSDQKVQRVTTDDEEALNAAKTPLVQLGIKITPTPADFHAKRVERYIQTLKGRKRGTTKSPQNSRLNCISPSSVT